MDTLKMVTEIKTTCAGLEKKKEDLLNRIKEIDAKLSYYNMAIQGLEQTIEPDTKKATKNWSRKAVMLEYDGVSMSITAWSKKLGISTYAIRSRIAKGWPMYKVLSNKRYNKGRKKQKPYKVFAYDSYGNVIRQFVGIGDASRSLNMPESTIQKIIEKMSKEDQLRVRDYYLAYVA